MHIVIVPSRAFRNGLSAIHHRVPVRVAHRSAGGHGNPPSGVWKIGRVCDEGMESSRRSVWPFAVDRRGAQVL